MFESIITFFTFLFSNAENQLIYLIISSVAFISGLITTIKVFKEKNIIKNVPRSKIRSVAIGLAEIVGTAKAITMVKTPISKQDCVYYNYVVKQLESNGDHTDNWRTIKTESSTQPFIIQDETGEIEVNPVKADVYLGLRKAYFASLNLFKVFSKDAEQKYLQNLKEIEVVNGHEKIKFRMSKRGDRKYYEYYLLPGDNTYVLGTVSPKDNSDKLFVHKGVNDKYFILGDKNENTVLKRINKKLLIFGLVLLVGVAGLALTIPSLIKM